MNLNHNIDVKKASRFSVLNSRNFKTYGTGAVVSAALISSNANALDVASKLTGTDAEANIETGALWVLGIAVTIFAARRVIGFFGR